jgi:amidophosphoribosyltransferase
MSVEEINEYIGSDSLHFMSSQELEQAAGSVGLCMACFTGNYPTKLFSYQSVLDQE